MLPNAALKLPYWYEEEYWILKEVFGCYYLVRNYLALDREQSKFFFNINEQRLLFDSVLSVFKVDSRADSCLLSLYPIF